MTMQAVQVETRNRWIQNLPPKSRSRMLEAATPEQLTLRASVHEVGQVSPFIYFPTTAVLSMIVSFSDGKSVEANMVGCEGFVPVASTVLPLSNTIKTVVQVGGEALAIQAADFSELVKSDEAIAQFRERYLAAIYDCIMQSVACNAVHSVRERCARWLMALMDRTQSRDVNVIHQVLAETLGASRPRVTEILATLQGDGFLELQRATLRIVDVEGLRGAACECYTIIKREIEQFPGRRI
jgi:CRP-like cAMP-binding protein